ncbi:MAG: hypothetical protein NZL95_01040 [Chitinophagales bacterium]|nr:hypothetical protein [Chitinophagales bacterium]MDW8427121.1 hypothetical protein [Chitinophagales bacterium]
MSHIQQPVWCQILKENLLWLLHHRRHRGRKFVDRRSKRLAVYRQTILALQLLIATAEREDWPCLTLRGSSMQPGISERTVNAATGIRDQGKG